MLDFVLTLAQQNTPATAAGDSVTAIAQILSNIGLAGAAVYAVIMLWRANKELQKAKDADNKAHLATIERLGKEKETAVANVQAKVDEMQRNQYELMVQLVPKLECLGDIEEKLRAEMDKRARDEMREELRAEMRREEERRQGGG